MKHYVRPLVHRYVAISALIISACFGVATSGANERAPFIGIGDSTSPPSGWVQFCERYTEECTTKPSQPRDVVLNQNSWSGLVSVNKWVNHTIQPMTDMEHYGMLQWWRYPDDGKGACHSYALLKRRMLIEAGWPREALLMTFVREKNGDGHAVLTAKTDRGEFILDNLSEDILPWSETNYTYYKRQSQADPNVWVSLDDQRISSKMSMR